MYKIDKKYVIALVCIVICVTAASLLSPQILRFIIDDYLMAGRMDGLLTIGFLYFGTFVLTGVFDFLKGWLLTKIGQIIIRNVRSEMQQKVTRLSAEYFTKNSSGKIVSKFMNDVDNISALFTNGIISMAIDCFKIAGIILSIWIFSSAMGVFALCLVPVIAFLTQVFRRKMLRSQKANLTELGKVNNHIGESIRNILMIKGFHRESYMENRYEEYLEENYRTTNKVNFYDSCYSPIIQVITALSIGFILYLSVGGRGDILGISIGQIAASVNLITRLFLPVDSLGTELQAIQKGLSGIYSIREFMKQPEEEPKEVFAQLEASAVEFEFRNVSFCYEEGRYVIKDFDLQIQQGENVVFVGRTGAGKTTLFKLATGIIKPTRGRVLINGVDAYRIAPSQKSKIFGFVEQSFSFIKGDVWDQISLGDPSIEKEEIEAAIQFVGLTDVIKALPQGFETLTGAEQFSQGQRQLLAIARALVSNPKVLMLDEVTANLDTVTEENVVKVLKKAGRGRTILSIAHRPSTIAGAERKIEI